MCELWNEAWRWRGGSSLWSRTALCCRDSSAATLSCSTLWWLMEKLHRSASFHHLSYTLLPVRLLLFIFINLPGRMPTSQLWSTLERTPRPLRPPCSSLILSDSSKHTRCENTELLLTDFYCIVATIILTHNTFLSDSKLSRTVSSGGNTMVWAPKLRQLLLNLKSQGIR